MGQYELVFLIDPRLSDEDSAELSGAVQELIESGGGHVIKEESWGKRRLAYPIQKLNEARYHLFQVAAGDANPFPVVEQRLQQNDKILRYLTVRLDAGRLRLRPKSGDDESTPTEAAVAVGQEG